jgi:hypothetical protein
MYENRLVLIYQCSYIQTMQQILVITAAAVEMDIITITLTTLLVVVILWHLVR